jgi:protein TonB
VHLALLAIPLAEKPRPLGIEHLQVRLTAPASAPKPAPEPAPAVPPPSARVPQPAPIPSPTTPRAEVVAATPATAPAAPESAPATPPVDPVEAAASAARSEVNLALARHFRYPLLARRQGWQGEVLLSVHIAADGSIGPSTVLRSSGHAVLDRAAVAALARVPALSWTPGVAFVLELPVIYRLNKG